MGETQAFTAQLMIILSCYIGGGGEVDLVVEVVMVLFNTVE